MKDATKYLNVGSSKHPEDQIGNLTKLILQTVKYIYMYLYIYIHIYIYIISEGTHIVGNLSQSREFRLSYLLGWVLCKLCNDGSCGPFIRSRWFRELLQFFTCLL